MYGSAISSTDTNSVLEQWRSLVLRRLLFLPMVFSVPVVGISLIGSAIRGDIAASSLPFLTYLGLLITAFTPRLSLHRRAGWMIVFVFANGVIELARLGLVGSGRLTLMVSIVLAAFLLRPRAVLHVSLASGAVVVLLLFGFGMGWLQLEPSVYQRVTDPAVFLANSGFTLLAAIAIASGTLSLLNRLTRSLGEVAAANASLEQRIAERTSELEAALRTNRFLVTAVNNMSIGMTVSDANQPDNPIFFANPAFTAITGYTNEQAVGKNYRFLQGVDTDPAAVQVLREAIAAQQPVQVELINYRKDQTPFWNALAVSPVFEEHGALMGFVGLQRDVTARHVAEQQLRMVNENLYQRVDELQLLNRIAQALTSWIELDRALALVQSDIIGFLGAADVSFWRLDDEDTAIVSIVGGPNQRVALLPQDTVVTHLLAEGRPFIAAFTTHPATSTGLLAQIGASGVALPLLMREPNAGIMVIAAHNPERLFTPQEVSLFQTVAAMVAATIKNAYLVARARAFAVEEERRRLARELHDSVSQALFAAHVSAEALPRLYELDPEEGREVLVEIQRLTRIAQAEMRALLVELRPQALLATSLDVLLHELITAARARLGFNAQFQSRLAPVPILPAPVQIALYRICQEALANVIKHSEADTVVVQLSATPEAPTLLSDWKGHLELEIRDNGRGFTPQTSRTSGLGLIGMRERASELGAELMIASEPSHGTIIKIAWQGAAATPEDTPYGEDENERASEPTATDSRDDC